MDWKIGRFECSRTRLVVEKCTTGKDAVTSILYRSKQGVSGQICGETLRMLWELDVLRVRVGLIDIARVLRHDVHQPSSCGNFRTAWIAVLACIHVLAPVISLL
jgi:hypothetical protein